MSTTEPQVPEESGAETSVDAGRTTVNRQIEIRTLTSATDMVEAASVLKQVWGSQTAIVPLELMVAISHSGGYVCAAVDTAGAEGAAMIGASVGFLGRYRDRPALHSHVTGILPGVRHGGIGRSMKLHQRKWAAERDIDWIVWTFDPLVRRNAWFNIAVLGVEIHQYLPSFYGEMADAINAGDESDRLLVGWPVSTAGSGDVRDGRGAAGADLVPTPEDIVTLRRTDPVAVARWRREIRTALGGRLAAGRRIVGFTRNGEYVIGPA